MVPLGGLVDVLLFEVPKSEPRRADATRSKTKRSGQVAETDSLSTSAAPKSESFVPSAIPYRIKAPPMQAELHEEQNGSPHRQSARHASIELMNVLFFDATNCIEDLADDPEFERLLNEFLQVVEAVRDLVVDRV